MPTVLVTGATGYIGGRLVAELLDAGHEVRCLVRTPSKLRGIEWADRVAVVRDRSRTPTACATPWTAARRPTPRPPSASRTSAGSARTASTSAAPEPVHAITPFHGPIFGRLADDIVLRADLRSGSVGSSR